MNYLLKSLRLLNRLFSLKSSTDYVKTSRQIRADVEFNNGNLWALIFAILIASIGLNINSTSVIIGAMLISPLMGPIVGAGFSLAINDFNLLRRSLRNLLISTFVAIIFSYVYFSVSPLELVQSELLARTRPTLYDVLIAIFGGSAGAIAVTRKMNKGNMIPGVAIATALMPPLCTAGFGLAQNNLGYFFGAIHLFLINALFICLSTLVFMRVIHIEQKLDANPHHLKKTRNILFVLTLSILIPSIYTGWVLIQEARFQKKVQNFVQQEIAFKNRTIVNLKFDYSLHGSHIVLNIFGRELSLDSIKILSNNLIKYDLKNTKLDINQLFKINDSTVDNSMGYQLDLNHEKTEVYLQQVHSQQIKIDSLEKLVVKKEDYKLMMNDLKILFPDLKRIQQGWRFNLKKNDSLNVILLDWTILPKIETKQQIEIFIKSKISNDSIEFVHSEESVIKVRNDFKRGFG